MQIRITALVAACALTCLLAGPSGASTPTVNRWIDQAGGFSLTLPTQWYPIPRTKAALEAQVAEEKAAKDTSLEGAYKSLLDSPSALKQLSAYSFQAFLWPPLDSLIPTEVNVEVIKSGDYTSAALPTYAADFASQLSGIKLGATLSRLTLRAGKSVSFDGTVSEVKGTPTGLSFYLFAHDKHLYILSFSLGDSFLRQARIAAVLRSIADSFSFSTSAG